MSSGPSAVTKLICNNCDELEHAFSDGYFIVRCNRVDRYIQDDRGEIETRDWCPFLVDDYEYRKAYVIFKWLSEQPDELIKAALRELDRCVIDEILRKFKRCGYEENTD